MNIYLGANPAFLTRNYLNRHANNAGDLTVSTGTATRHRPFDMDPLSRWQSAGSDDTIVETINFGLWVPGARSSHNVEYILVQNHNIKGLTVEYSNDNGTTWATAFNSTTLAEDNTRIILVSTPMDRIRLTMTTQTANAEKAIGDIIVCRASFSRGRCLNTKWSFEDDQKTAKMADGSLRGQLIGRSDASFHFWAAKCAFLMDPASYGTAALFNAAMTDFRGSGCRVVLRIPAGARRPAGRSLPVPRPSGHIQRFLHQAE